jgi:hypothetical protein
MPELLARRFRFSERSCAMMVAGAIGLALTALGGCTTESGATRETPQALAPPPVSEPPAAAPEEVAAKDQVEPPGIAGVSEKVERAIRNATRVVGVDTPYMLVVAERESSFDPARHARRTSATGLYQFTAGTWLRSVRAFGEEHGLDQYARQIVVGRYGAISMRNATARARLLRLRTDPELSALMAAELARDNEARLEHMLGRRVAPAELYMAHLLGVNQAARVIQIAHRAPYTPGARLLPAAARTNPHLFRPAGRFASAVAIVGRITTSYQRAEQRFAPYAERTRVARAAELASMPY